MYSQEIIKLAPQTNEALEKLGGKKECYTCEGQGIVTEERSLSIGFCAGKCKTCHATGKVKWTWQPKVGQQVIYKDCGNLYLIYRLGYSSTIYVYPSIHKDDKKHQSNEVETYLFTPILHWEEIERILEGLRYDLWIEKHSDEKFTCEIFKEIDSSSATKVGTRKIRLCCKEGKTRQLAVMRAVIALWKKVK